MDEILILGAGRVGSAIARALASRFKITVVDTQMNLLMELQANSDLRIIQGNAADPETLKQADVEDASTVVAVTAIDEVNLVACRICSLLSENIKTVARIRSSYYNEENIRKGFEIGEAFCPEQLIAQNIKNAIIHPGCLSVHRFAGERLALAGVRVSSKADIAGETINELRNQIKEIDFRVVALHRDGEYITSDADTRLFVGDDAYVLVATDNLSRLTPFLAGPQGRNKRVFIAGGGGVGQRVAAALEGECDVKIIEMNRDRCRILSQTLKNTLVLKGKASDEDILQQENIGETDIFCALTNDDEENILSAMLAKRLGAKKSAVLINRTSYVDILERQIDIVLSPSQITTSSLLSVIRPGDFNTVHTLLHGSAEAVEFTVHGTKDSSQLVDREINQIQWPEEGIYPGGIVRGEEILIVRSDTVIRENDHVICFIANRRAAQAMEKFVQPDLSYIR